MYHPPALIRRLHTHSPQTQTVTPTPFQAQKVFPAVKTGVRDNGVRGWLCHALHVNHYLGSHSSYKAVPIEPGLRGRQGWLPSLPPGQSPLGSAPPPHRSEPQAWKLSSVISVVGQQGPSLHHTPWGARVPSSGKRLNTHHYSTLRGSLKH